MPLSSFVRVRTQFEGLHYWPDAPVPEDYLRSLHRHLFVVEADIEVFHDDREIEINAATRWLDAVIPGLAVPPSAIPQPSADTGPLTLGSQSCEQFATRITQAILERYGRCGRPRRRWSRRWWCSGGRGGRGDDDSVQEVGGRKAPSGLALQGKRMVTKQQMRWTPRGAHLLLHIRTRVLNNDLTSDFHRWYPGFTHTAADRQELAA